MMSLAFDFSVPADHPSLPGHFPGRPIVHGVVLLDEVMSGLAHCGGYRVRKLQEVKFLATMRPGETATARCEMIESARLSFEVSVIRDGAPTVLATGRLLLRERPS